jgi:bifunctional DNase/RNase
MNKIQVEIAALSSSPSTGAGIVLLLKEIYGERRLPIIIGISEAMAIESEQKQIKPPRPMTHDLMKTIIDYLSATISEVFIDDLKDNTFYAKIFLEVASFEHVIDARPSDAIALALRFDAPIYVSEEVLNRAGFEPSGSSFFNRNETESDENIEKDSKPKIPQTKLALLQEQLREALEKEDYERAAKLRDEIKKVSRSSN